MRRTSLDPWPAVLLVLTAVAGASACARPPQTADAPDPKGPVAPSFAPIVFPRAGAKPGATGGSVKDPSPVDEADRGLEEKRRLAEGYAAGGFDDEALEVIRQTLAMKPPLPEHWVSVFQDLRRTLAVRRLQATLLRADARGRLDYVTFGSDVEFEIEVRNVSGRPVTMSTEAGESPPALALQVARQDHDIYAARLGRSWTQTVGLQKDERAPVRLPAGGVFHETVRVPAADVGAAIQGVRVLDLSGTLRGSVRVGDGPPTPLALPLRPARVVVVPDGYEPLTRDPLASMETAVTAVAPTHILVAAEFVGPNRVADACRVVARALAEGDPVLRTAALGALDLLLERAAGRPAAPLADPFLAALDLHPDRSDALMDALARIADTRVMPDARLWRDWWQRAESEGRTVPARVAEGR